MGRQKTEDTAEQMTLDKHNRGSRLRLLNEHDTSVDEESEYDVIQQNRVSCRVTCCGFFVGACVTIILASLILFVTLIFGISYTALDAGVCRPDEIGIAHVCVSCPIRNGTVEEGIKACEITGAEIAGFGVIKAVIDSVERFAIEGMNDFISISRISESVHTCVRSTSKGAASIDCPNKAAIICQRPRPLGRLQESIRSTRVMMGLEPPNMYARNSFMFTNV